METREAFDAQVRPHRPALLAHAYRMLGHLADAEDVVQETLVRAWQHRGTFEGRASLRSWPWTICARAALTRAERTARRELPGLRDDEPSHSVDVGAPSPEVPWLEPMPDAWLGGPLDERESPEAQVTRRQSVALAFLAALQLLPPLQRAALLLTAVLAWSAAEVAEALETTVPAVNSALQRARQTLELKVPHWSASRPSAAAAVSAKYVDAWTRGDADALAAKLRDDVTLAMPPFSAWFSGRADVVAFLRHFMAMAGPWEARVCEGFNGALAVELRSPSGLPPALHLVTLDDHGAIASTMVFVGRVGAAPPSPAG
jgi:RNA polymerase sigma-70 factor, ECF subfamily